MSIRTTAFGFKQGNKFGHHLTIGLCLTAYQLPPSFMVASVVSQVNYGHLLLNKLDIRVFEITTLLFGPLFLIIHASLLNDSKTPYDHINSNRNNKVTE